MIINNKEYKEIEIDKLVINGKEQKESMIPASLSKNMQEINITVYTKQSETAVVQENEAK